MNDDVAGTVPQMPSFGAALRVWTKIGLLSFGGPAGHIPVIDALFFGLKSALLVLSLLSVAGLVAFEGGEFADVALFFSKMAVVTIGGTYAVLAYVAQAAVQAYHWLEPADLLAGLGLVETTPGPLILVLQFVRDTEVVVGHRVARNRQQRLFE